MNASRKNASDGRVDVAVLVLVFTNEHEYRHFMSPSCRWPSLGVLITRCPAICLRSSRRLWLKHAPTLSPTSNFSRREPGVPDGDDHPKHLTSDEAMRARLKDGGRVTVHHLRHLPRTSVTALLRGMQPEV
jgi:hypothetical protein